MGPLSLLEEQANWQHIVGSVSSSVAPRHLWKVCGGGGCCECVTCSEVCVLIVSMAGVTCDSMLCAWLFHAERIRDCCLFFRLGFLGIGHSTGSSGHGRFMMWYVLPPCECSRSAVQSLFHCHGCELPNNCPTRHPTVGQGLTIIHKFF